MEGTKRLIVYKDSKGRYGKRAFLPFDSETIEFKSASPATYILTDTYSYGCDSLRRCGGCFFNDGKSHMGGCGTMCFSNSLQRVKIGGDAWRLNENLSIYSPHNIYEKCEPIDIQYMVGTINVPIICTQIILEHPIHLCTADGSPYEDTSEITVNGKCINTKEGYVFRLCSEVFNSKIVVMRRT